MFNLMSNQDSQVFFYQDPFQLGGPQHALWPEFTHPLVELDEVSVSPFLQPAKVPLDGIAAQPSSVSVISLSFVSQNGRYV